RRRGMSSARWTAITPEGSARGGGPSGTWSTAVAPAVTTRERRSRQKGMGWATTASATAVDSRPSTSSGTQGRGSTPPFRRVSSSDGEGVSGPTTRTGRVGSIEGSRWSADSGGDGGLLLAVVQQDGAGRVPDDVQLGVGSGDGLVDLALDPVEE